MLPPSALLSQHCCPLRALSLIKYSPLTILNPAMKSQRFEDFFSVRILSREISGHPQSLMLRRNLMYWVVKLCQPSPPSFHSVRFGGGPDGRADTLACSYFCPSPFDISESPVRHGGWPYNVGRALRCISASGSDGRRPQRTPMPV